MRSVDSSTVGMLWHKPIEMQLHDTCRFRWDSPNKGRDADSYDECDEFILSIYCWKQTKRRLHTATIKESVTSMKETLYPSGT